MRVRTNPCRWLARLVWGFVLAVLLHGIVAMPGVAQPIDTEPVFVSGLYAFEVPGAGELTAVERALAIESNLSPLVTGSEPVSVRTEIRGGQNEDGIAQGGGPVILANDRYIMTVTTTDAMVGGASSPEAQAEEWTADLTTVLNQARAEHQTGFLTQALVKALMAMVVAVAFHWLAGWLWQRWLSPLLDRCSFADADADGGGGDASPTGLRMLSRLLLFLVRGSMWLIALNYIANLFPLTRQVSYRVAEGLRDGLFARSLVVGSRSYSLLDLLLVVATLLGLVIVASAVTNLLRSRVLRATGISIAAQEAIAVLSKYAIILLGTVVILQVWGLDLSSIALVASGLGIGVGLGLQGLVKDFVSGLVLVFERPVQVGDFVDFGDVSGTVARIGSRSTAIRTLDHVSIIVPNSRFLESEVINWSHDNPVSRIRLPVGVSYSADPQQVKLALLEACKKNQEILSAPGPLVFFKGFGDSALEFQLLVWIAQPSRQFVIKSDLYFAIEVSLRQYGIEVPFPQRDLHIRSGQLPIELSTEAEELLRRLNGQSGDR
jgi:potassium efflux system protein